MTDRKETPDLLGAVLDAKTKKATGKQSKQKASKPESQHTIKTERSEGKVKVTYYVSQAIVDALEDAQYRLRKMAGENRSRVSRSLIVELSVKMALEDLEDKGDKSRILKEVL